MNRYRVALEFDVEIHDEEQAKRHAAEYYLWLAREGEREGAPIVTEDGKSPEDAARELADNWPVTMSTAALLALGRGSDNLPWLSLHDVSTKLVPPAE